MNITSISPTELSITEYITARDRGQLYRILRDLPERQRYVEAASEGVTFVANYFKPELGSVQIAPPEGKEFGPDDVWDILNRSTGQFGSRDEVFSRLTGRLDDGVVLTEAFDGDVAVLGQTFRQIRREDTYPHA